MKKLLLIVAAVIVIAGGLAVATDHYKTYQNKQKASAPQVITVTEANRKIQDVITAESAEYKGLVVQYNNAVAQCQKGAEAYAKLTPIQKHQTAPPVCPAAQE